jgi:hypothetical protein
LNADPDVVRKRFLGMMPGWMREKIARTARQMNLPKDALNNGDQVE